MCFGGVALKGGLKDLFCFFSVFFLFDTYQNLIYTIYIFISYISQVCLGFVVLFCPTVALWAPSRTRSQLVHWLDFGLVGGVSRHVIYSHLAPGKRKTQKNCIMYLSCPWTPWHEDLEEASLCLRPPAVHHHRTSCLCWWWILQQMELETELCSL